MKNNELLKGFNDIMILKILYHSDSYGYEISKHIRQITDNKYSIKETTLYSALNRLENNGYVKSYLGTQSFGKRRTYFKITPLGKIYYLDKCNDWKEMVDIVSNFVMEV
jgi:PadR family transcriptional regulator PadR